MGLREAKRNDIEEVSKILLEVADLHEKERPDIFKTKTLEEIKKDVSKSLIDKNSKVIVYEEEKIYDLALRKFITSINNVPVEPSREPQISSDTLADLRDGRTTTAEKIHPKNPLTVQTGDTVVYTTYGLSGCGEFVYIEEH